VSPPGWFMDRRIAYPVLFVVGTLVNLLLEWLT
jgi:hypothetical protein